LKLAEIEFRSGKSISGPKIEFLSEKVEFADEKIEFLTEKIEFEDRMNEFADGEIEFPGEKIEFLTGEIEFANEKIEFRGGKIDFPGRMNDFAGREIEFTDRIAGPTVRESSTVTGGIGCGLAVAFMTPQTLQNTPAPQAFGFSESAGWVWLRPNRKPQGVPIHRSARGQKAGRCSTARVQSAVVSGPNAVSGDLL
jgi:hypothetical protein